MTKAYYLSLARELYTLFQRQELLLQTDKTEIWADAGSPLRALLRRFLPANFKIGRGHIWTTEQVSPFLDVIVYETNAQLLYQEGDLVIVPRSSVVAILGGVGRLDDEIHLSSIIREFSKIASFAHGEQICFTGLVAYKSKVKNFKQVLQDLQSLSNNHPAATLTHVSLGSSIFYRIQDFGSQYTGSPVKWQAYNTSESTGLLAAACIIKSLIQYLTSRTAQVMIGGEAMDDGLMPGTKPVGNGVAKSNGKGSKPQKSIKREPTADSAPKSVTRPEQLNHPAQKHANQQIPVKQSTPVQQPPKTKRIVKQPAKPMAKSASQVDLHAAVKSGKAQVVSSAIATSQNLEVKDKHGNSPLHAAVKSGNAKVVRQLLDAGSDVNSRNYVYDAPLHVAVEQGNSEVVQMLIKGGAEVEARNNRAYTPLHKAAMNGNIQAVRMLLDHYADIHACMEKDLQPLHVASWYGQSDVAELLIRRGASINAVNIDGNTPLHFAAFNGQVKLIKLLINHKANTAILNKSGESYLQGVNEGYQGEMIRVFE
ncbi:ankyrin repeat domain-containing protein [Pontibacter sp. G13]|uniref:ankyrin repeat domain-containing protein n=1 Tax=Pontibacter sp. G13 TaxID=3074898 RepID=UPI00288BC539|nr:ankyrin repeat domain-containing protein [Pontibacter sp. G13]WNJ20663.1 ankyrin repeat domain-containing protein [Pontibacter sp. G13]